MRPFVAVDAADGDGGCPKAAEGNGLTAVAATDDMAGEAAGESDRTAGASDGFADTGDEAARSTLLNRCFNSGSLPVQDLVVGASVRGKFDDDKQWYNGQVTERTNRSIPKFSYYSNTTTYDWTISMIATSSTIRPLRTPRFFTGTLFTLFKGTRELFVREVMGAPVKVENQPAFLSKSLILTSRRVFHQRCCIRRNESPTAMRSAFLHSVHVLATGLN